MTDMASNMNITSIEDFVNQIPLEEDYVYLFRGHSDEAYKLEPSIYRASEWISNEDKLIKEVLLRCPEEFNHQQSAFEKLVKLQHYGLPTRLLDVTENPLIALYFACLGAEDKDGEVLVFRIKKEEIKYFDSDTVSVLSNIAWMNYDFGVNKHETVKTFNNETNGAGVSLLHSIKNEKPHFKNQVNPDHIKSVVCVKPLKDNNRIIRQDGLFFLFGIKSDKSKYAELNSDWHFRPNGQQLIIQSSNKKEILQKLNAIGINAAKLFPEIDSVTQFVKTGLGWKESESGFIERRDLPIPRLDVKWAR